MTRITESEIEEFALKLLEDQGYQYVSGPEIAPDGKKQKENLLRTSCSSIGSKEQSMRSTSGFPLKPERMPLNKSSALVRKN